jgi:adenine deaminase
VSDDRHPDDLLEEGHMNAIVNKAMALGMDPVLALTLATLTPALYFRLNRRGAIAPGYVADFSLSRTLNPWTPHRVFKGGVEVAREGALIVPSDSIPEPGYPPSPMRITRTDLQDLRVLPQPGRLRCIRVEEGTLLTGKLLLSPKIENGAVVSDIDRDILKLAVYNRYAPGLSPSVAFVQGFGMKQGAMATTVAHDSHNLIAVGTSDEAILHVVRALIGSGGGMAAGTESGPVDILPLPVAGLMSDQPLAQVVGSLETLKIRARTLDCSLHNPFMALSFLALPVIPSLKLTDQGLVDVSTFSFVPLFEA